MAKKLSRLRSRLKASASYLDAGIHENCYMVHYKAIDANNPNKQNSLTFVKHNEHNEEIGRRQIAWFNFDHNSEFVNSNLQEMLLQLMDVLEVHYDVNEIDDKFQPFRGTGVKHEDEIPKAVTGKAILQTIFNNIHEDMEVLLQPILDAYEAKDFKNLEACRLKLIVKNSYTNQPNFGHFVESMEIDPAESLLKLTAFEMKELEKWKALTGTEESIAAPVGEGEGKVAEKITNSAKTSLNDLSTDEIITTI